MMPKQSAGRRGYQVLPPTAEPCIKMGPENIIVICVCDLCFVTFVIAMKIKFFTQTIECVLI